MYIRSFHIDAFRALRDVDADGLSSGLTIFLGNNEAGKSTCLEFIRSTLTGYPKNHRSIAGHSGIAGGSLVLSTADGGIIHLTRRPGNGSGALALSRPDGSMLASAVLDQILYGITGEVYRNVFGFTLSELEQFESLSKDGVRNALYGASFGSGIISPSVVLQKLRDQTEALFKPTGIKPPINQVSRDLEELRKEISEVTAQCAGYDEQASQLTQRRGQLASLRHQKSELEKEHRLVEKRLGVWQQWNEWRMLQAQMDQAEPISENFPEDGAVRLHALIAERQAREHVLAKHREKLSRMREGLDAFEIDDSLVEALPKMRTLAERKSSYRHALRQIDAQQVFCQKAEDDLKNELSRLGPDWSCERIRQTDRSLFAREDLEKQAKGIITADSSHQAAIGALGKANRDVEAAEREVELAQGAVNQIQEPVAILDEVSRDDLRQTLARLEENHRQIPVRERALQTARTAFARAYDPLHLRNAGTGDMDEQVAILDNLLDRQESAIMLVDEIRSVTEKVQDLSRQQQKSEMQVESVKARMDDLRENQQSASGPTRGALDARASSLRSLRGISVSLQTERDRLQELENRIGGETAPSPIKSLPMMLIGIMLMLAGIAVLFAFWHYGITSFAISETLTMPVTLWSGYLILASGVGFLAGGLPRSGPDIKSYQKEMAQLHDRRDACALKVAELTEQARQLCLKAGVDSMDQVTIEATELLLERERELCFNEDRSKRELDNLRSELEQARKQVRADESKKHEAEDQLQQLRKRWHETMLSLKVNSVPLPESASTFFARAESARVAYGAVMTALNDVEAMHAAIGEMENQLRTVPAVAERLSGDMPYEQLVNCVKQVLESCRDADAAREQRIRATATLENCKVELDRCIKRQSEAAENLASSEQRLSEAKKDWNDSLKNLGLEDGLVPETVREAFKYMDNCLNAETALERARAEHSQSKAEMAGLEEPLAVILSQINRAPSHNLDGSVDWIASLDAALDSAQKMQEDKDEAARLASQIAEEEENLRTYELDVEEARRNENNLLSLAETSDIEDFLKKSKLRDEQRKQTQRFNELEEILRLQADNIPFDEFMASFQGENQEQLIRNSATIQEKINNLADEEMTLVNLVGDLNSEVSRLTRDTRLAELRQKEAQMLESLDRMANVWAGRTLARSIIEYAKQAFERERQPEVIRHASEIFATITDKRWRGISASLEDASLAILPAQGEPVSPENLSRGTQEQAYLALRLAYVKSHAEHADALPLLMDEVLVNFDPQRAKRTITAFADLINGNDCKPHQLFYFTCQPYMVDLLRTAIPECTLFQIENGTVKRG